MAARRRRTMALRERFGPEYERAVGARENQRCGRGRSAGPGAGTCPAGHQAAVRGGPRRATPRNGSVIQQSFVDQPEEATTAGYDLVNRVMAERGYPMRDFDARADLVSVDHPDVVENYRVAHGISRAGPAAPGQHRGPAGGAAPVPVAVRGTAAGRRCDDRAAVPAGQAVLEPRRPVSDPALSHRPVSGQPVSDQPSAASPSAASPWATGPSATRPSVTGPSATSPSATSP